MLRRKRKFEVRNWLSNLIGLQNPKEETIESRRKYDFGDEVLAWRIKLQKERYLEGNCSEKRISLDGLELDKDLPNYEEILQSNPRRLLSEHFIDGKKRTEVEVQKLYVTVQERAVAEDVKNANKDEILKRIGDKLQQIFYDENACLNNPCKNNGTCQTGYSDKGFRCLCIVGFKGPRCKTDIDECAKGTHNCSADATCNNTKGGYNCTCKEGYYGDGNNCEPVSSCKEIFDKNISRESKTYPLIIEKEVIRVYCHMNETKNTTECGDGGWTIVMKINGENMTFHYDSPFWSNTETFNPTGGKTGFDNEQTKLHTYWNTSFTRICLGMKIDEKINFIVIDKQASSLYSLIADGKYRNTSLGRATWKKLIGPNASLQPNCNKEGFNTASDNPGKAKARIGIIANEGADHCMTSDSNIGFGTGGHLQDSYTCGNLARHGADNGDKSITAMGYILVQ